MSQKFVELVFGLLCVIPAKAGIQMYLNFLDSGSRYPGLDPGLPGMTFELCCELQCQDTRLASRFEIIHNKKNGPVHP